MAPAVPGGGNLKRHDREPPTTAGDLAHASPAADESAAAGRPAVGDDQLARWMERAASHQTRALAWLRQSRDPSLGPMSSPRRRDLLLRALEHLVSAQRLLERTRASTDAADLHEVLDTHVARLADTVAQTERRLHDLDAAAEG